MLMKQDIMQAKQKQSHVTCKMVLIWRQNKYQICNFLCNDL